MHPLKFVNSCMRSLAFQYSTPDNNHLLSESQGTQTGGSEKGDGFGFFLSAFKVLLETGFIIE